MEKVKGLFSTPKRAIITVVVMLLILGILGAGIAVAAVYLDYRGDMIENRIEQEMYERLNNDGNAAPAQDTASGSRPSDAVANPPTQNDAANAQKITAEQAEDIALKDAGIARTDADRISSHFEMDDGFYQYEVHIFEGEYEYEYTVSAEDGSIFEKDMDYIFD